MTSRQRVNSLKDWIGSGWLLFLLPLPLIPALFISLLKGALSPAAVTLAGIGLFIGAGISTRLGMARERAYELKKFATAPRLKLKLLGGLLTAAGTFICARLLVEHGWFFSLFTASLSLVGYYLSYGFDPMKDKSAPSAGYGYTNQEVAEAIKEAEEKIHGIHVAAQGMKNRELQSRLIRIGKSATKIVGIIEDNPRDLRRARKFLNVYLDGAHKVAKGYVDTHARVQSDELESNFRNVLVSIETVFSDQYKRLLEHDVQDLDIQIEVLDAQLRHEGIV